MNLLLEIKITIRIIGLAIWLLMLQSFQVSDTISIDNEISINPDFEEYNIRDGLSSNVAYAILEDRRGFIWVGTQDGLNRFDGYNFKVYGTGPEGGRFISHFGINVIFEDQYGYIWIGTEGGGLNCYDPETEMFWHFFHNPEDPSTLSC